MTQTGERADGAGVLRRLLQLRDQTQDGQMAATVVAPAQAPTPARAAATAFGRAAERLYGLAVQPISIRPGALTLAELPELMPEGALLLVLQGPADAVGVIALDPQTVTSLIEVQALGRLTSRPAETRRPTRSDAMICADFVDAVMQELGVEMAGIEAFSGVGGYRYAAFLDDVRTLSLMLEDTGYRSLACQLRLGSRDAREATILLALPQPGKAGAAPLTASTMPLPSTDGAPPMRGAAPVAQVPAAKPELRQAVQQAPLEVTAILCRCRIGLGELQALTPGKMLPLPRISLSDARIETPDGQLLAIGKFGEADGCHAIRLRDPDAVAAPVVQVMTPAARSGSGDDLPLDDLSAPDEFRAVAVGGGEIVTSGALTSTRTATRG